MWKTSSDTAQLADPEPEPWAEPGAEPSAGPGAGQDAGEPLDAGLPDRAASGSRDLASQEAAILHGLAELDRASRRTLLEILSSDDAAFRGRAIRALYRSDPTRGLAELLIDCEVEPDVRALLLALLRELERG